MISVLVDTGPLVALLDAGDEAHRRCLTAARRLRGDLVTTWPVITEAVYLLGEAPAAQEALLGKIGDGTIHIADLGADDASSMRLLLRRYRSLPMDLADASLVRVAEREGIFRVFTLDRRDFSIYQVRRRHFDIAP